MRTCLLWGLFLCLIAFMAVPVHAQTGAKPAIDPPVDGAAPPKDLPPDKTTEWPPPPPKLSPEEVKALTMRLVQLEDARLRLQGRIIEEQSSSIDALNQSEVDTADVAPDIVRIRSLSRQLLILSDQALAVARRLGPPKLWPQGPRDKIKDMQIKFKEEMLVLKEGRRDLAKAWKSVAGEDDPQLDEDLAVNDDKEGSDEPEGMPESEEQAGKAIQKGDVQEAQNLIEVFMRVPESTTPRAKLDYYRRLRKERSR